MGGFLKEFWTSWIEATGGTVAFIVAAYLYISGKSALGPGALIAVGLFCFFLASYNAWNKKRVALADQIRKNDEGRPRIALDVRRHDNSEDVRLKAPDAGLIFLCAERWSESGAIRVVRPHRLKGRKIQALP